MNHYHNAYLKRFSRSRLTISDPERRVPSSWKEMWSQYFAEICRNTTLQGLVHFTYVKRHPLEHVLWFLVLFMAITFTVLMCHHTYEHFMDSPTVISIESDYREWNVSMFSAFFCPEEKVDEDLLNDVSSKIASELNTDLNIVSSFLRALANLSYYNLDSMKNFIGKINIPPTDYMKLVKSVSFNFSYKPSDPTMEKLIPIYTDFGMCYTYNSQIVKMMTQNVKEVDGNGEYKIDPPLTVSYLKPGSAKNLYYINSPLQVFFVSTWDFPTVSGLKLTMKIPTFHLLTVDLAVRPLIATEDVRNLNINRRKCRFYDESNLKISSLYSLNLCQSQCRIDLAVKKCGCAPFFHEGVLEAGYNICDAKGMLCLADITEPLMFILGKTAKAILPCKCFPTCESFSYKFFTEPELNQWQPVVGGTSVSWKMSDFPKIRSKRDILFTFSDLLVAFGGTAGLFLGFSVLSIVEIVYYITLRPFFYVRDIRNLRKKNENRRQIKSF